MGSTGLRQINLTKEYSQVRGVLVLRSWRSSTEP